MILKIYSDGGARGNPGPAAIGVVIYGDSQKITEFGEKIGLATNNFAEYTSLETALVRAAAICQRERVELIEVFMDSQLVINQITGQFKIKNSQLAKILGRILSLEKKLPKIKYNLVARENNRQADKLVNLALDQSP